MEKNENASREFGDVNEYGFILFFKPACYHFLFSKFDSLLFWNYSKISWLFGKSLTKILKFGAESLSVAGNIFGSDRSTSLQGYLEKMNRSEKAVMVGGMATWLEVYLELTLVGGSDPINN